MEAIVGETPPDQWGSDAELEAALAALKAGWDASRDDAASCDGMSSCDDVPSLCAEVHDNLIILISWLKFCFCSC